MMSNETKKLVWKDKTDYFPEEKRYYKESYLERCEVLTDTIEVNWYSKKDDTEEIYFSYGKIHGLIYCDNGEAIDLCEQIKKEIEEEYLESGDEPSKKFINSFSKKYKVDIPNDIFFDFDIFGFFKELSELDKFR